MSPKTSLDPRPELGPQAEALAGLARGALGHMTATQRARGLALLGERLGHRGRRWPMPLLLAGGAAAAVALVGALHGRQPAPGGALPLAYRVEGGAVGPSGAIVGQGAVGARPAEPTVRFADGTAVKLLAGARGRLTSVDAQGARFAIERGAAEVRVTPRPNAHWQFDAGPFLITVHGTVFTAAWDEADGRLDLRMERGLVSVTGPVAGGPLAVRGGQHLTVTLRQARVILRELDEDSAQPPPQSPSTVAPAAATPAPAVGPAERPPAPRITPARPAAASGSARAGRGSVPWVTALAAGDLDGILRDADRDEARALGTRGSDELAALADAARYRRRDDLARDALRAQRRRFPRSVRATDAAFLLGRLEESDSGGLARAVRWYDRYLEEAPSGAYASEALGRKMVAVQKLYGTARARVAAEEYARRFPSGTYAGAARALRDAR